MPPLSQTSAAQGNAAVNPGSRTQLRGTQAARWAGKAERGFIFLGNNQHGCKVYATRLNTLQRHCFFPTLTDKRWLNIAHSYPAKWGNLHSGSPSTLNLQPAIRQYEPSKIQEENDHIAASPLSFKCRGEAPR